MLTDEIKEIISDLTLMRMGQKVKYDKKFDTIQQQKYIDLYSYLIDDSNEYRCINEYLQLSNKFHNFQVSNNGIPFYWALISIIDASNESQPIKYLFGPASIGAENTPSFLFRSIYDQDKQIMDENADLMHNLGQVASLIRHNASDESAFRDLTSLREEVVYVSSGEIDYHLLKWCIKYLEGKGIDWENKAFKFYPIENYQALGLGERFEKRFIQNNNGELYFIDWLVEWGLSMRLSITGKIEYSWTPRGLDLLETLKVRSKKFEIDLQNLFTKLNNDCLSESKDTFQKEIHYIARFRSNIWSSRGILRFSHADFKINDNYIVYTSMIVKENLSKSLKITHENIKNRNFNSEISCRLLNTQSICRMLMGIEYNKIYVKKILPKIESQRDKYAAQSAISQVLARNMSHNIGSHVSYRATNGKVKKRATELEPNIKYNLNDFSQWLDYFSEKLDKYEIYRNEYLSDFDQSPRFVRFYQDLVLPFCENILVMDNIAAGEHLNYKNIYKNCLAIRCTIDGHEIMAEYPDLELMGKKSISDEEKICYPDYFPYLLRHKDFQEEDPEKYTLESAINNKKIVGASDVEICIHSEQAIYSILENFIRNSAKHKPKNSSDTLTIYLDLYKDGNDGNYTLLLRDDTSSVPAEQLYQEDGRNLGIYQRITQSLLDESGKPRRANWGFADMKINSFLLYNRVNDIEDNKLPTNFNLVAIKNNMDKNAKINLKDFNIIDNEHKTWLDQSSNYQFGYRIKLSPARKILYVGEFKDAKVQSVLEREGLVVVKSLPDMAHIKSDGLVAFQFVVIKEDFKLEEYLKIEYAVPGRILALKGYDDKGGHNSCVVKTKTPDIDTSSMEAMLVWCWQEWLISRNPEGINLYLYFDNVDVANIWSSVTMPHNLRCIVINNIEQQEKIMDNKVNILYNHHGGLFNQKFLGKEEYKIVLEQQDGDELLNFSTKHSNILFDKASEDFGLLNYPPNTLNEKKLSLFQLMDAATTNVFIIDERISEYAEDEFDKQKFQPKGIVTGNKIARTNWNMFAQGKMFCIHELENGEYCCDIGRELSPEDERLTLNFSKESMSFTSNIENLDEINKIRKDVLIIHRTYLDKEKIGMNPDDFLKLVKSKFGSVFITSGGGYPHNLSSNCKFIPFSVMESCINNRLSKTKLNNILQSSIKIMS
jgi:hypothetical protein